jgi:OOP family OmpA-OmpF porin
MSVAIPSASRLAAIAGITLLAACSQQPPPPAPPPVAANPPAASVAQVPASDWYQVTFASGSANIDSYGRGTIDKVADAMAADPALVATIVGKADPAGGSAANMRLSKARANSVHTALLRTGKVTEQRLDTRWTGDHPEGARPMVAGADVSNRVVDIALHR